MRRESDLNPPPCHGKEGHTAHEPTFRFFFSCLHSALPSAAAALLGVGSTEKWPEGTPARFPSSASARAVRGVFSAGFTTALEPLARKRK